MSASAGWLAVEVVRAGLDPLTGRTLSFNHVPMAAWAGTLCDLVLLGDVVDRDGVAVVARGLDPGAVHPVVASAWGRLEPRLPRPWRLLFGPQTVDVNSTANEVRRWLVEVGMWSRRRTVFGPRYASTGAVPASSPPPPPGPPDLRQQLLFSLLHLAQVGTDGLGPGVDLGRTPTDETELAVHAVLTTTTELIAWKAANPALLRPGL